MNDQGHTERTDPRNEPKMKQIPNHQELKWNGDAKYNEKTVG